MAITDYKVTEAEIQENDMYNAKNQWINEATDLKNKFDALPKKTIEKYNQLIDALLGNEGFILKSGGTMTGDLNVVKLVFPTGGLIGDGGTSDAPILITVGTLRAANVNSGKYDLGAATAKWRNLYLSGDARIDGALYVLSGAVMHNTVPETSNTYDLGSSSRRWRNIYLNGPVYFASGSVQQLANNGYNGVCMSPTASPTAGQALQIVVEKDTNGNVWWVCRPGSDKQLTLGWSNRRFNSIYAASGTINTSDRNEKNSIKALDKEKAAKFINGVNPVSYKFNDGASGRTHWGMISQDIEELMESLGLSSLDFAGFIKSPKTEQVKTGEDENGNPIYEDKFIEGEYTYGLRYDEFIAPMIATIQYQQQKIDEQSKQIEDLTKRVKALEGEK